MTENLEKALEKFPDINKRHDCKEVVPKVWTINHIN